MPARLARDDELPTRAVFTTGDVARLVGIGAQVVIKQTEAGILPGRRLPSPSGRQEWRFDRAPLVAWLRLHGIDHALRRLGEPVSGNSETIGEPEG